MSSKLESEVRLYLDTPTDQEVREVEFVRDQYFPDALLFQAKPHPYHPSGCWNILNSLREGYKAGFQTVFFVEEDVMVHQDYFTESVRLLDQYDIVSGRKIPWMPSFSGYTNPGAAWTPCALSYLVPHIDGFLEDRSGYLEKEFGRIEGTGELDDSLIQHIVAKHALFVGYPDHPIVSHQGFQYYRRLDIYRNEGNIEERIIGLRKMLKTIQSTDRYARDFEI